MSLFFATGTWPEVLDRAKAEQKPVFLFAYTAGCRYCRQMEQEVFPQAEVAESYNDFINYRIDIQDGGPGEALAAQYAITAFPTYLYFDPRGQRLHQSGSFKSPAAFIAEARNALDTDRALFSLMRRYDSGERTPELLYHYANALTGYFHEESPETQVTTEYLATQTEEELREERNLRLIFGKQPEFGSAASDYLLGHAEYFVPLFGEEEVQYTTHKIIRNAATTAGRAGDTVAYARIRESIAAYFPDTARMLALAEINYLQGTRDWPAYAAATLSYTAGPGAEDRQTAYETAAYLNAFTEDPAILLTGAAIMELVTEREPTANYLLLYARLLHGSGQDARALDVARRAVHASQEAGDPPEAADELLKELGGK